MDLSPKITAGTNRGAAMDAQRSQAAAAAETCVIFGSTNDALNGIRRRHQDAASPSGPHSNQIRCRTAAAHSREVAMGNQSGRSDFDNALPVCNIDATISQLGFTLMDTHRAEYKRDKLVACDQRRRLTGMTRKCISQAVIDGSNCRNNIKRHFGRLHIMPS